VLNSVEHPLDVSVQRPHEANPRHHGRAIELDDQEQGFYRGLLLLEILLGLGKLRAESAARAHPEAG